MYLARSIGLAGRHLCLSFLAKCTAFCLQVTAPGWLEFIGFYVSVEYFKKKMKAARRRVALCNRTFPHSPGRCRVVPGRRVVGRKSSRLAM